MGQPSFSASNAIIYLTYGVFLITGTSIAWTMRFQGKKDFLSGNGTQSAFPLALNFIASSLGAGILFAYPELATFAGVQGVVVYALASSLPMLRYGTVAMLYLSFMTLVTLFLYMVAELSALGQVIGALTGLDKLPVIVVQCVVTTIYTSLGGFKISFLTDVIQGAMVVCLIIVATITVGVKTEIKPELIDSSGLTKPSLLGWQLVYILPVAILTNDFFLSHFWLRTFSSKSDKDLWIGVSVAMVTILCVLTLVGCTGLISAWSGAWPGNPAQPGSLALFLLLGRLPNWVVGIVLIMVVSLSTAAFDSLQSAMVSSASNDFFRNRLGIWYIRGMVVIVIIPAVVLALKASSILQIFLVSDLLSAATIPVLCLGLSDRLYWWRGFEVVVGGLGGILAVFIFGTVYFGDAHEGGKLLLLQSGLYSNDWSVFGAFVAAPVGGVVSGFIALALRLAFQLLKARVRGERFDALDRPIDAHVPVADADVQPEAVATLKAGKFF
ncbi:urea transport protein [Hirsutella rhossiliensis]|uniref:Urea transport protein n=1 Tax=Hirsutella rhossiliensis TaxID=111463 RepID=A0A9P8N0H2_9HYPO|nr:urea transport protein [Hirsutella rhossiliensis]KAH0964357.1 urea transport protein [Hirsutella rhossiliensis]